MWWYMEGNKEQGWRRVGTLTPSIVTYLCDLNVQSLLWSYCFQHLHTQNALNQLKSSALLTHSDCIQPTQIKTYNAGMWTHEHPMFQNTSKEHQSSTCAPPNSRWPPKPWTSSKALQNSSKAPKAPPIVQKLHLQHTNHQNSLNAHK